MPTGGGHILLIEDEDTSREITRFILEGAGYHVDSVDTAAAAHGRLSTVRYDLVIADWVLPDGDGIYLADRAAGLGFATIVATGHISDLPPGAGSRHHLLAKPFNPGQLLAVVSALIAEPSR
jgi:two-component system, cell cycle response regulator CpdR